MMVTELIKKAMLAGLGAQEKAKELIEELVKAGELSKGEAATLVKEWASKAEESAKEVDAKVKDTLAVAYEKLNIPTRDDYEKIDMKLHSLSLRIKKLESDRGKCGE